MARGSHKRLTENQRLWNELTKKIKRLGYESELPDKPKRITSKAISQLEKVKQEAQAGSKARAAAVRRVKYYQKRGYLVDASIIPERGKKPEEYEQFTGEKIKQEAQNEDYWKEDREPPEDTRYDATLQILRQIDQELSAYVPAHPYNRNAMWWVRWKETLHDIIQGYWDDVYADRSKAELVALAARLESRADTLRDLIQRTLYASGSKDTDNQNLSLIIEILTNSKLSAIESAYINDVQEGLDYD